MTEPAHKKETALFVATKERCAWAIMLMLALSTAGCGVRGRPQPPLTPAQIGRGQPTFTRGSEDLAIPNVPSPDATPVPSSTPSRGDRN